jgi:hypothetical protein
LADLSGLTSVEAKTKGAEMLEGLTPPKKQPACKVRSVIESLEAKDQEILKKALADAEWPHSTLTHELNKRGIEISEQPVRIHRLGRCSCSKT